MKNLCIHNANDKGFVKKELLVSEDCLIVWPKGEKDESSGRVAARYEDEENEEDVQSNEDSDGRDEEEGESEVESHGAPEATAGNTHQL